MIRPRLNLRRRSGAAAAEMAVVMNLIMVPLMIGTWEMGRVIHVQQIVSNSAREGARLAAQAVTITDLGVRTQIVTQITPASNTQFAPNVKAAVMQYLAGAGLTGLTWNDVTVTFTFLNSPTGAVAGATEPYQGIKNQRFSVTVSIPFDKVRWVNLGIVNPTTLAHTTEWQMMVDDPFTINTTLPTW